MKTKNGSLKECVDYIIKEYKTDKIRLSWEGGNDDGSYTLTIGDEEVNFYDTRQSKECILVDILSEKIGYYSFAGDFYASGEIEYDSSTKCFKGMDDYEECAERYFSFRETTGDLKLKIPSELWFDSISIDVSGSADCPDIMVRLLVVNGPVYEEHIFTENSLVKEIGSAIESCTNKYLSSDEIRDLWFDIEKKREELKIDEDKNYIVSIEGFSYTEYETTDTNISIPIS